MTSPTIPFTLAFQVNGYLVVRPDGSHESIPIESDRFRVIAEGAWRTLLATGATLYRTPGGGKQENFGYSFWVDASFRNTVLHWDLSEHHRIAIQQRKAEEARKATEVAA